MTKTTRWILLLLGLLALAAVLATILLDPTGDEEGLGIETTSTLERPVLPDRLHQAA